MRKLKTVSLALAVAGLVIASFVDAAAAETRWTSDGDIHDNSLAVSPEEAAHFFFS